MIWRDRIAGNSAPYLNPYYIRNDDPFYADGGYNPYYDPERNTYTNFTGDPYYSNYFGLNTVRR